MSIKIRKAQLASEPAVVAAINALIDANLSTQIHRDKTSIPAGDSLNPSSTPLGVDGYATGLASSIALANELKGVLAFHMADSSAHEVADSVNVNFDGYALATNLSTVQLLANAMKVDYTAHLSQSGCHVNNDSTNTITAADATDQSTSNLLLNNIATKLEAHMADAGAVQRLIIVDD